MWIRQKKSLREAVEYSLESRIFINIFAGLGGVVWRLSDTVDRLSEVSMILLET